MEVFSLLKYWRTTGSPAETNVRSIPPNTNTNTNPTTTIRHVADETDEDDDDGPFFDLEFTVPVDDVGEQECDESGSEVEDDGGENENETMDFTVDSSGSTGNQTDSNLTLSPSDDLFFKGRFIPLESSELSGLNSVSESHSTKLQFPGSFLKPATKLRVLMLGLKKPKSEKIEPSKKSSPSFTVKFKVEEVPIVSLFSRDNSSRNSNTKIRSEEVVSSEEKKVVSKDSLQKYLKMVKQLNFRVSKEKLGLSGQLLSNFTSPTPLASPSNKIDGETKEAEVIMSNVVHVKNQKEGNLTAGLRNVRKHLGKSRSASSAVAAVPSSMATQSRRHDDSLLQQQDGIQSAILHCKRSFTASRESDSSALSRCASDPSHEKSKIANSSRTSLDESRVKI